VGLTLRGFDSGAYGLNIASFAPMSSGQASRRTVALLSPFSGGNLGDAAILSAFMQAMPADRVQYVALTIDPISMKRTHGLSGMAMTGTQVRWFFGAFGSTPDSAGSAGRRVRSAYRHLRRLARRTVDECLHWVHAARFLRDVDLLLVAGGGQIDEEWGGPWGEPYALFKWSLLARLRGTRVAFASVGVCRLQTRLGRWFCRRALSRAAYVSVRDPWSGEFIVKTLGQPRPALVPDAAFGLSVPSGTGAGRPALTIGVSPIAYGRDHLWPTLNGGAAGYREAVLQFVIDRTRGGDHVVLFNTDGPDWLIVEEIQEELRRRSPDSCARVRAAHLKDVPSLFSLLAEVDVVVASRLHGVILSHVASKPVLAISYDRKVTAHMAQIDQAAFVVPFDGLSAPALHEAFEALLANRDRAQSTVETTVRRWHEQLASQNHRLFELVWPGERGNVVEPSAVAGEL
jgi:polysaccharide pyruvyl transferase WcaK-like protein